MEISQLIILIEKYNQNRISEEELGTLYKLLERKEYANIFKSLVKDDYQLKTKNIEFNKKNSFKLIETNIEKTTSSKNLYKNRLYKYAAAASILLMVSLAVFWDVRKDEKQLVEPITQENTIFEPGSNKAILTLEDGSLVKLEKGETFQTKNVNVNEKGVVYKEGKSKTKKLVYNYLTIPRGGEYFVKLSDGTQVWLNSETQLKYPVSFNEGETREVQLVYGEAYFDVSPSTEHNGSKFIVATNSQEVEVIGTEFNIKAYKDETNVYTTLVEGKVSVENMDNNIHKYNLVPNQQLNFDLKDNKITIAKVDTKKVTSWKNGVFSFDGKELKDIMKVISRWYDVDIVFENKDFESIKFKGNLSKNQSIERILAIMKSSTINNYEIKDKTIILK